MSLLIAEYITYPTFIGRENFMDWNRIQLESFFYENVKLVQVAIESCDSKSISSSKSTGSLFGILAVSVAASAGLVGTSLPDDSRCLVSWVSWKASILSAAGLVGLHVERVWLELLFQMTDIAWWPVWAGNPVLTTAFPPLSSQQR